MGNGTIDVGNKTLTRKPGQPAVEVISGSAQQRIDGSITTEPPCGAMSQQGREFLGNLSAPQKFVHLIGCREPKVKPGSEVRGYPNPVKR